MKTIETPILAWFSCGAASAVACKLALSEYSKVRVIYIETGSHHSDNNRFIDECQKWFNHQIEIRRSEHYSSVFDVIRRKRFINSPYGAPCTFELKKKVRYKIEDETGEWYGQIFGFDYSKHELKRAERFTLEYPKAKPIYPLINHRLSKEDCLAMLRIAGIELPAMYRLGYLNNNCIGCVKGGISYWNKIRVDFPDVFQEMALLERTIGASCLKDKNGNVFLDELDPSRGAGVRPLIPECSLYCQLETLNL